MRIRSNMKRSCEPSLTEENAVDKRAQFTVNLSSMNGVSLENIQISEAETVMDLQSECATEIIHSQDESQITQDEDSLVAETSFGILIEFMDIKEPLNTLRSLLEIRTGINLSEYSFYLQDSQELDPSKNLVNQCVQGEGLVQINVDVTDKKGVKKINIIDVLKPIDEVPASPTTTSPRELAFMGFTSSTKSKASNNSQHVTRWYNSPEFKKIQERYGIPIDPILWTSEQVKIWFDWASSHFNLPKVDYNDFQITGAQLISMSHSEFIKKVPIDTGDLFWTHLELLRKFKIVAILEQATSSPIIQTNSATKHTLKNRTKSPRIGSPRIAHEGSPGYSGQIQLWQFLLELLTDKDHRSFIQWVGNDGEFKLINPEMVAQLWGQRKNKPTMNYEKLSRALRYYYDGEMIAKVHGKRFVYKFVYDLKSLLGYDASQLNRLVSECAMKQPSKIVTYSAVDSNVTSS